MRFVPNSLSRTIGRQILKGQKNSPTLLFAIGVVGVVGTAVLAARATLKVDDILTDHEKDVMGIKGRPTDLEEYTEKDKTKDIAHIYARTIFDMTKLYAPSVGVGILTIGALGGSHRILTKRNAGLLAAYSAVDKAFNQYRQRVVDEFGTEKDRDLRYGSETKEYVTETAEGPQTFELSRVNPVTGASMYAKFFDDGSREWKRDAEYNLSFIRCQQNWANDLLMSRGHLFLNEVYDSLGLERTRPGSVVGWIVSGDGDNYVDFGVFKGKTREARDFVNGRNRSVLLDFNVDGVIWNLI